MLFKFILFYSWILKVANCGWFYDSEEEDETSLEFRRLKTLAREIVHEDFMKQDKYLLRFFNAFNNDTDRTLHQLEKTVKWREENNISTILYENFTAAFGQEYPYVLDGSLDKAGRPLLQVTMGQYNLRKIILAGRMQTLLRYVTMMVEVLERFIYYRRITTNDVNLSQAVLIYDVQGFSLAATGCLECMKLASHMVPIIDAYYVGLFNRIYFLNVPRIFDTMLQIIKSTMQPSTREALLVFDSDREKWKAAMAEDIPPESLRYSYGGLIPDRHPNSTVARKVIIEFLESEFISKITSIEAKSHSKLDKTDNAFVHGDQEMDGMEGNGNHDHHHHFVNTDTHSPISPSPNEIEVPTTTLHQKRTDIDSKQNKLSYRSSNLSIHDNFSKMTEIPNISVTRPPEKMQRHVNNTNSGVSSWSYFSSTYYLQFVSSLTFMSYCIKWYWLY